VADAVVVAEVERRQHLLRRHLAVHEAGRHGVRRQDRVAGHIYNYYFYYDVLLRHNGSKTEQYSLMHTHTRLFGRNRFQLIDCTGTVVNSYNLQRNFKQNIAQYNSFFIFHQ